MHVPISGDLTAPAPAQAASERRRIPRARPLQPASTSSAPCPLSFITRRLVLYGVICRLRCCSLLLFHFMQLDTERTLMSCRFSHGRSAPRLVNSLTATQARRLQASTSLRKIINESPHLARPEGAANLLKGDMTVGTTGRVVSSVARSAVPPISHPNADAPHNHNHNPPHATAAAWRTLPGHPAQRATASLLS
jgi:hypothetical protein